MLQIDFTEEQILALAKSTVNKGFTVQGVQKKMSLHLAKTPKARLTLVDYPNGYILKPQTAEYQNLPEYEHTTMLMAEAVGVRTVPHALIKLNDQFAYITKRVDRATQHNEPLMYAMEDFCQLSGRLTEDKYRGSYEQCGKIIKNYSSRPNLDVTEFYLRIVFCYITGNSDMHLKNFSLREQTSGKRDFILSEGYDLLPVNLVNPKDKDETALALNGKTRNIRKKDLLALADNCQISSSAANKIIASIVKKKESLHNICENSLLNVTQKKALNDLIDERIELK